jgi:hypothetical protein
VLALCRDLLDAGALPAERLEAWRGPVLCLQIRSLGEAAMLEVGGDGVGFRPVGQPGPAPSMRFGGSPYEEAAE